MSCGSHARHTILVVDDEEQTRRVLEHHLTRGGHDVASVSSAEEALEHLKREIPCLFLVDVAMPGMGGFEFCRRLKRNRRTSEVPIILCSGRVSSVDVDEGLACGAVDYVKKPFDRDELLLRVRTQLTRRTLEAVQRRSEHIVLTLSRVANDAIVIMDDSGAIIHWNEAAERMFGYRRQEAIGADLHRLIVPPQYHDAYDDAIARFRKTGKGPAIGESLDLTALRRTGEEFPIELSLASSRLGGRWCAFGIIRDVTARRRENAEAQQFRLGIERATDAVFMTDIEGRIRYANPSFYQMYGLSPEAVIGSTPRILKSGHHDQQWYERMWGTLLSGESVGAEIVNKSADGRLLHVQISNNPILDANGSLLGFLAVHRDVTERNRVQERFRVLFDSSLDAIMTLEPPEWRLTSLNPATLRMFGAQDEGELKGQNIWEHSPELQPDGRRSSDRAQELIELVLRDGSASFEWSLKRLGGEEFPARVLLTRMELGGQVMLQATVRDITEERRVQVELGHARKLEAVGQLAAGIAHEINTPTQFVNDSLHFLRESLDGLLPLVGRYRQTLAAAANGALSGDDLREIAEIEDAADLDFVLENAPGAVERCLEGIARITTIVKAMKEFAHPDQREKAPADLNVALMNTLTIARNEYKYVADVETDLAPLPQVDCLLGDLNQVFLNLIVNAAHAIEGVVGGGGDRGVIRVSSRPLGTQVCIRVSDTGGGIPLSVRDRIFEPFFTTKPVGKGTGQGLAIARSIVVDKHGGSLTFVTEDGCGTTFEIRLPVRGATVAGGTP